MEEVPSHEYRLVREWRMGLQNHLRYIGIWESVKDGYIPPKRVKLAAQKEAKRNNALALEIIQKDLSKAMRDKMKTITSAKELLLSLEQIYKKMTKKMKKNFWKCLWRLMQKTK